MYKNVKYNFFSNSKYLCSISLRSKLYAMRFSQSGFTLIELLVVFFLMGVLSVTGLAAFSSFNTTQRLNTTILDLKNTLNQAKSQAINQVDTCQSGQQFSGYEVKVCCPSSSSSLCNTNCSTLSTASSNGYELDIVCGGTPSPITGKTLPAGLSINTSSTTTYTILFNSLTNTVTGPGQVSITQGSTSKNISISSTGVIQ